MRVLTELLPNDIYETLSDCCAVGLQWLIPALLRYSTLKHTVEQGRTEVGKM